MDEKELLEKRVKELEIDLEDVKSLSGAKTTLLEANIKELTDVYNVLSNKLKEINKRDKRIRVFFV